MNTYRELVYNQYVKLDLLIDKLFSIDGGETEELISIYNSLHEIQIDNVELCADDKFINIIDSIHKIIDDLPDRGIDLFDDLYTILMAMREYI